MYDYDKVDKFLEYSLEISKNKTKKEAFEILTKEIEKVDEKYLNEYISGLIYLQYEYVLNWIEENKFRIKNVSQSWGQLAASSKFNWIRAENWILEGRPLSLVALDALVFCTTKHERLNQSPWMRELNPKLTNSESIEIIAQKLTKYAKNDNVPRVKNKVKIIIENLFE
ncbi:hypothetical protein AAH994_15080 [Weeksellaceae bacterium A-14]